jgi:hypothetical protein
MDRYVVVHGHFHQPPRDNPWLELIEQQDSAWPAHDCNERNRRSVVGGGGDPTSRPSSR